MIPDPAIRWPDIASRNDQEGYVQPTTTYRDNTMLNKQDSWHLPASPSLVFLFFSSNSAMQAEVAKLSWHNWPDISWHCFIAPLGAISSLEVSPCLWDQRPQFAMHLRYERLGQVPCPNSSLGEDRVLFQRGLNQQRLGRAVDIAL